MDDCRVFAKLLAMSSSVTTKKLTAEKTPAPGGREDHRVRVARQKRERMRAHLLKSVMAVFHGEREGGAAVIDDVVRHADVARGTFYQYFPSLEDAVAECGSELAIEMTQGIYAIYDVLEEPVMRVSTGFQTFLLRSLIDHQWGAFLSHIGLLAGDNLMIRHITQDIARGIETGDFFMPSPEIGVDLLVGAKIEAMRRIISGRGDLGYVKAMTAMVLHAFGVTPSKAEKQVEKAFANLQEHGPAVLSWWRPIT